MPSLSRTIALVALPLTLTACQTYEATYVETPRARRTVVVERSYDPFYEPASTTVYRERRVYRDPFYDPYAPTYRDRRYGRDYDPRPARPYVAPPVVRSGPVYGDRPSERVYERPSRRYSPEPAQRDEGSMLGSGIGR